MPMGAPMYRPDPKSACRVFAAPIVLTQADELAETGSWSTGVFQMLSAGRTGQVPMAGAWAAAVETANRMSAMAHAVGFEGRTMKDTGTTVTYLQRILSYRAPAANATGGGPANERGRATDGQEWIAQAVTIRHTSTSARRLWVDSPAFGGRHRSFSGKSAFMRSSGPARPRR